ncbi:hypothetical protein FE275_10660 [Pseudomonas koreensis]|nr:hypothetical protein FE275_10660 [Pseudomonas koreensis]
MASPRATPSNPHRKSPVGVSLLAIAVSHSTSWLDDTPPSRAGSLLQGPGTTMSYHWPFPP